MSKSTATEARPSVKGVLAVVAIALTAGVSLAMTSLAGAPTSPQGIQLAAVDTGSSAREIHEPGGVRQATSPFISAPYTPGAVDYDRLALDELDKIVNGADGVTAGFDSTMRQHLSQEDMAANWAAYQAQFGDYQSHGEPEDLTRGEITVVNVPLEMAHAPGQFRIAFHADGQIAGVFLLRTGVPTP
jgi:hypothetical protein